MADDDDRTAGLSPKTDSPSTPAADTAKEAGAPNVRQRRRAVRTAGAPGAANEAGAPNEASAPKESKSADAVSTTSAPKSSSETAEPAKADWKTVAAEPVGQSESDKKAVPVSDSAAGEATKTKRSPKSLAIAGIAGVLLVALIAAAVILAVLRYQVQADNEKRQEYVDAAKQAVLNLTTIHPESAQDDVARIIDGSTGEFREDFEGRRDPFVSVVQDSQVKTDGTIVEAAMEKFTDGPSTVLVAAKTTVSSADQPEPADRDFRMRVTVVDEDGTLKASKLEFVP